MATSIYTKSTGFKHEKQCITMQNMAFRKPKDTLLQDRTRLKRQAVSYIMNQDRSPEVHGKDIKYYRKDILHINKP